MGRRGEGRGQRLWTWTERVGKGCGRGERREGKGG